MAGMAWQAEVSACWAWHPQSTENQILFRLTNLRHTILFRLPLPSSLFFSSYQI
jgi:hypothetical protein